MSEQRAEASVAGSGGRPMMVHRGMQWKKDKQTGICKPFPIQEEPVSEFTEAMRAAGWRYDPATDGYRKGKNWVSRSQAEAALVAAEEGRSVAPEQGLSESFAEVLVSGGMNDNAL